MNNAEHLYKVLLDNHEDFFLAISDSGLVLELNHNVESICMISRLETIGKKFFDICSKNKIYLSFGLDDIKKISEKKSESIDVSIKTDTSTTFLRFKVIKILGDNQTYYVVIGKDITELLGYKKASIKSQMYLQTIIENLPEYVYWKDVNFVYQGCNKLVSEYLNLKSPKDIIGKTDNDFGWSPDRVSYLRESDESIILSGKKNTTEDIIPLNNTPRIMLSTKAPLYDNLGKIMGIIGVSVDITEQKRLEAIKDDFISNMQHDIRTPFAGIGAIADLFCTTYSSKYPEIKNFAQIQHESCLQWEKIQIELLKAIDTKQPINFEKFYLQDKIDEIKELLHATAEVRHLALVLECQSREETGEITSDKLKIGLILQSLVSNALNFTEKGSVTIRMCKNKSFFVIDIIDTGIGIPEDKFDYIFEKFSKLYRSNKYAHNFKGLGLGLYSCRRDARKIGAKISIKSIEGVGSTFTLILPASFNVSILPQEK